jgi:hypothetical protein
MSTVLLKKSYDLGQSWEPLDVVVDSAIAGDLQLDNGNIHIVYKKYVNGQYFLYYRRWEPGSESIINTPMPSHAALSQNYPNPFNAQTKITFTLSQPGAVRLAVYDLLGRECAILVDGTLEAGKHGLIWNGRNREGDDMPSGIYFYRLVRAGISDTEKMILLR